LIFKFYCASFPEKRLSPYNSPALAGAKVSQNIQETKFSPVHKATPADSDAANTSITEDTSELNKQMFVKDALQNLYAFYKKRRFQPYATGGLIHARVSASHK
jgi:hypothetical protein